MGRIMDVFGAEFLDFRTLCGDLDLEAEAKCNAYPPRMVVTRPENLFDAAADKPEETKIVITGGLEPEITVKGAFSLRKKEMDSIIRKAVNVLNIYLHAYVQDHMKYEAAREGGREA
jgi:hypothetical protein